MTMRRLHMCRHGPWLAAEGPLAYSPAAPPAKDYFFPVQQDRAGNLRPEHQSARAPLLRQLLQGQREISVRFLGQRPQGWRSSPATVLRAGLFSDLEVKTP